MVIVKNITREILYDSFRKNQIVYSEKEFNFLKKFAPLSIVDYNKDKLSYLLNNSKNARKQAILKIFKNIITLSPTIYRETSVERLKNVANRKLKEANPLFEAAGFKQIEIDEKDPTLTLFKLIKTGYKFLEKYTPKNIDVKWLKRTEEKKVSNFLDFKTAKKDALQFFDKDAPLVVYGSAIKMLEDPYFKPNDIDTLVVLKDKDFTLKMYRDIMGKNDIKRKPPLSFVIVPEKHLLAHCLADRSNILNINNSRLLNGSTIIPEIESIYFDGLELYHAANLYGNIRATLTLEGLKGYKDTLWGINYLSKLEAYVQKGFQQNSKQAIPQSEIANFSLIPEGEALIDFVIGENLRINGMLNTYLQNQKTL
ncbi:MAG: hypothetical protein CVU81_01845 [Euryarchaeota archaeon HGW-Euryarchaeota-1]|nr:MAG: hypothetical protein CVU81_01845 [Euryarchaeota archaeon HGW-Euryarchaeota-1]